MSGSNFRHKMSYFHISVNILQIRLTFTFKAIWNPLCLVVHCHWFLFDFLDKKNDFFTNCSDSRSQPKNCVFIQIMVWIIDPRTRLLEQFISCLWYTTSLFLRMPVQNEWAVHLALQTGYQVSKFINLYGWWLFLISAKFK